MTKVVQNPNGTWTVWFEGYLVGDFQFEEQAYDALLEYANELRCEGYFNE